MKVAPVGVGATPEGLFEVEHDLVGEPLLSLEQIASAATLLPEGAVEGADWDGPSTTPSPLSRTLAAKAIEAVADRSNWFIVRHLERLEPYRQLMVAILAQVRRLLGHAEIECLRPACFVFVSSPGIRVPAHIDPEHNFLFQIRGSKTLWCHPRAEGELSVRELRAFYADEFVFQLQATEAIEAALVPCSLEPGRGVYIPVTAPHRVTNHHGVSLSFSVTFRTAEFDRRRLACLAPGDHP